MVTTLEWIWSDSSHPLWGGPRLRQSSPLSVATADKLLLSDQDHYLTRGLAAQRSSCIPRQAYANLNSQQCAAGITQHWRGDKDVFKTCNQWDCRGTRAHPLRLSRFARLRDDLPGAIRVVSRRQRQVPRPQGQIETQRLSAMDGLPRELRLRALSGCCLGDLETS